MEKTNSNLKLTLTYFPVRGECDPIRILLAEGSTKYNYRDVEGTSYLKFKETLPFGDVPVLENHEDDFKLIGREVIFRYLAMKAKLTGAGEKERAMVDLISDHCFQLEKKLWSFGSEIDNNEKILFENEIQRFFEFLTSILENSKTPALVGNKFTAADVALFCLLETLERERMKRKDDDDFLCFDGFSLLISFKNEISKRKIIKAMNER